MSVNKSPRLEYPAGQRQTLEIRPRLIADRTLADFSAFTLTVREDPDYPRAESALDDADPLGDAWAAVDVDAETEADGDSLLVSFTVPADAGVRRYALDVRGTLAVGGGSIWLYPCTWLSVDVTC